MDQGLHVSTTPFALDEAVAVLARTPAALDALLRGLPDAWIAATEGPDTWSPFDVIGHLVHCERADWMPRARIILEHGEARTFDPLDRFAQFTASQGRTLAELLDEFAALRRQNLDDLRALDLTEEAPRPPRPPPRVRHRHAAPAPRHLDDPRPRSHRPDLPHPRPPIHRRGRPVARVPARGSVGLGIRDQGLFDRHSLPRALRPRRWREDALRTAWRCCAWRRRMARPTSSRRRTPTAGIRSMRTWSRRGSRSWRRSAPCGCTAAATSGSSTTPSRTRSRTRRSTPSTG